MQTELERIMDELPEGTKAEIVQGMLIVQSAASLKHQETVQNLQFELGPRFHRKGWLLLPDVQINLAPSLKAQFQRDHVRPDYAGWRIDRAPVVSSERETDVMPDWICEVLSPSNEDYDRGLKLDIYETAKLPYLWFVDPERKRVEAYAGNLRDAEMVARGADVIFAPPFDEHGLALEQLWLGF